ncbi:plasmid maintenance system antidote protein VapI [Kribbella aluminosa]|uniref:Plasmid maintenance system antidote protein VapI n=1 Tax=Kribbella aluminosa TaxID=416017 RepID=A0ABS4UVW8_9ACTN|nr:helix-turn-helix domain-containing protein [Kribbella aluminosa]MBP2355797.1 plasmid maintenance system antidote protein VapI [Kribbella aluminosa]
MTVGDLTRDYRSRLAELLGEPLMVDDPLITTAQAAVLLGVEPQRVAGLVRAGHLPARSRSHRRLYLSDVVQSGLDQWMSVAEAGAVLGLGQTGVRRLISAGLLAAHGKELPLRRAEVEVLATLRDGWLTLSTAASALGVDVDEVQRLLRNRHLTHTCDVARPVYRHELAFVLAARR